MYVCIPVKVLALHACLGRDNADHSERYYDLILIFYIKSLDVAYLSVQRGSLCGSCSLERSSVSPVPPTTADV